MLQKSRLTALIALALVACSEAAPDPLGSPNFTVIPEVIELPDGFWPEGITFGRGPTFFVSSLATGAIYRGNAVTGAGGTLAAQSNVESVGLKYDPRQDRLVVAGGTTGKAFVYHATTGALLNQYQLAQGPALINDVILIGDVAYFTDSFNDVIYRVALNDQTSGAVSTISLTGDWVSTPSPIGNANGIVATPAGQLIVVNMSPEALYLVDPASGHAQAIDLGGATVTGDGLLLVGHTLYVVDGPRNQIASVRLGADFLSGELQEALTHPGLRFPSTIARFANALYAVNARFDVTPEATTEYEVVRVPLHP